METEPATTDGNAETLQLSHQFLPPNQLVMVIVRPNNLNVSCKLCNLDYSIYCWWDLIRLKQLSSVPVYRA